MGCTLKAHPTSPNIEQFCDATDWGGRSSCSTCSLLLVILANSLSSDALKVSRNSTKRWTWLLWTWQRTINDRFYRIVHKRLDLNIYNHNVTGFHSPHTVVGLLDYRALAQLCISLINRTHEEYETRKFGLAENCFWMRKELQRLTISKHRQVTHTECAKTHNIIADVLVSFKYKWGTVSDDTSGEHKTGLHAIQPSLN